MISSNGRACTIYSPRVDFGIRLLVRERFPKDSLSFAGPEDAWHSLLVETRSGSMRLKPMQKIRPGDEFSRILLGTWNFVTRAGSPKPIVKAVLAAQWLIGTVADPSFDADARFEPAVLAIAAELGALIFTGTGMLAPRNQ